jgi:hypothetical protein
VGGRWDGVVVAVVMRFGVVGGGWIVVCMSKLLWERKNCVGAVGQEVWQQV